MKNFSKKSIKHLLYVQKCLPEDLCLSCGAYDWDYGCTMGLDSWYACDFESMLPWNYSDVLRFGSRSSGRLYRVHVRNKLYSVHRKQAGYRTVKKYRKKGLRRVP